MPKRSIGVVLLALGVVACTSEDKGTSIHCFDQQKRLTLPAFVQTTCPTVADTVTNSPPTTTAAP